MFFLVQTDFVELPDVFFFPSFCIRHFTLCTVSLKQTKTKTKTKKSDLSVRDFRLRQRRHKICVLKISHKIRKALLHEVKRLYKQKMQFKNDGTTVEVKSGHYIGH